MSPISTSLPPEIAETTGPARPSAGDHEGAANAPSAADIATRGTLKHAARRVRALFEEARRLRRRRWMRGIAVLVVLAAIAATAAWATGGTPTARRVSRAVTPPRDLVHPSALPPEIVVWGGGTGLTTGVEVISSKTGRVVRTLATDVGLYRGTPQPAVSRYGDVYFDTSMTTATGAGATSPRELVEAVPIAGGAARIVAEGHDPAVSPDGRYLAYMTWTDLTNAPEGIVVDDLSTGASTTWQFATDGPDLRGLWWSPDSHSLSFAADEWDAATRVWVSQVGLVDLSSSDHVLDRARAIALPLCPPPTPWADSGATRDLLWEGYLNSTEGIGLCQHVGLAYQTNYSSLVVVNLATGRVVRRLPPVHTAPQGSIAGVSADAAGDVLSFVAPDAAAGGLYRWSIGAGAGRVPPPVLVRKNVGSSAWVPPQVASGVPGTP